METREVKMGIAATSGNASKNSKRYSLSIPSIWAKEMGITQEDRTLRISFDGKRIMIEKV